MPAGDKALSQEIMDAICDRIAEGESLRKICKTKGMPRLSTIFRALGEPSNQTWRDQYARAREAQADALAEKIQDAAEAAPERVTITIGENATKTSVDAAEVQHRRLKVDALKWIASKLKPKKYGDRQEVEHTGKLSLEQALAQTLKEPEKKPEAGADA